MTLDANDLGLGFHEVIGSGKLFRQLSVFNCQQRELHPYVQEEGRGDCFQSMLEGLPMRVPSPPGNEPPTIHHLPPPAPKADQGPSDDEMDQKPPQRSTGIAKIHSAGFIVEFITAKNPAQTEFINSRATNFPGLYRRERHRD